ncbi:MAG: ABC transporter permease [Planctomycetota bacterium]
MTEKIHEIIDRLNRAQKGLIFRIAASVIGVLGVLGIYGLTFTDFGAQIIPASYIENIVSGSLLATLIVLGVVWLNQSITALFVALITLGLTALLRSLEQLVWAESVLGTGVIIIAFLLAVQLIGLLFSLPWRPLAVAKVVIDEALRMKLALVFIVALIIFIPTLIAQLDPSQALRYRIQTFLSYGTGLTYGLLAVMTLFMSVATVAFEQRDKQIFQIVSKPLHRGEYLLGKWIGIMGLNFALLVIISGSVFWFTQYLRTLDPIDEVDRMSISEQVLTARVGVEPDYGDYSEDAYDIAIQRIEANPDLEMGDPGVLRETVEQVVREMKAIELSVNPGQVKEFKFSNLKPISEEFQATVVPGERVVLDAPIMSPADLEVWDIDREVRFGPGIHFAYTPGRTGPNPLPAEIEWRRPDEQRSDDLKLATNQPVIVRYFPANAMTLRFKINAGENDPGVIMPVSFFIEGQVIQQDVALVQTQTMLLPAGLVQDDGSLTVGVLNGEPFRDPQSGRMGVIPNPLTISFPPDGLEVMYKVSTFEANYLRGVLITWIKLGFLAMLGIATATFASFPVACLLAFSIFFGSEIGPFLNESLEYYEPIDPVSMETDYVKLIISWIATAVNWVLASYGDIRPTKLLIEGRLIGWDLVLKTAGIIGVAWTGLSFLVGWHVFRSRQLAIYSGHA